MNKELCIIREIDEYEKYHTLVREFFKDELRFPNQVFRPIFKKFMFEEFSWAMSAYFWNTIQHLANQSLDSYILMAVIEPHPVEYFHKEFGYYNWFKLPTNITSDDYWDILNLEPEGSPADALLSNSEVVVWVSPSKKWAIWGERSAEICVLATNIDFNQLQEATWRSADKALTELVALAFPNQRVPKDFAKSLKANYKSKG